MTEDMGGVSRRRASLNALKPLVPYALKYKGQIVSALAALFVATGATLILPIAARRVIDHGFSETDGQLINAYFGMLMAVVCILALASAARYYFVTSLGKRVVADLRAAVFRYLVHLDAAFFDSARSGEIVLRLTAGTTQVKTVFGVSLSIALRNSLLFLGSVFMMVWTSPKLSALVLMADPCDRPPACILRKGGAPQVAQCAGQVGRCIRLCRRSCRRRADHAGFQYGKAHRQPFCECGPGSEFPWADIGSLW